MTKKLLLTSILLSTTFSLFSQEFITDIHSKSIEECVKIESKLGSEQVLPKSHTISFNGNAQPIKFVRKEEVIPDLEVYYYFNAYDSTMTSIRYLWDVRSIEKKENNKQSLTFQKALAEKYYSLEKMLTSKLGKSIVEGSIEDLQEANTVGLLKKNTWQPNDSTEVILGISISNVYQKEGIVSKIPTHRIRLQVLNKKEPKKPVDQNQSISISEFLIPFFQEVENGNLADSKSYFSNFTEAEAINEMLDLMRAQINFEQPITFVDGSRISAKGSTYVLLEYTYTNKNDGDEIKDLRIFLDVYDKIAKIKIDH